MTALETFTTASKRPLTTGRRPDMTAIRAFETSRRRLEFDVRGHRELRPVGRRIFGKRPFDRAAERPCKRTCCAYKGGDLGLTSITRSRQAARERCGHRASSRRPRSRQGSAPAARGDLARTRVAPQPGKVGRRAQFEHARFLAAAMSIALRKQASARARSGSGRLSAIRPSRR